MISKKLIVASAVLAREIIAHDTRGHAHQYAHEKRAFIIHTQFETVYNWVTVTATQGDDSAYSSSPASVAAASSSLSEEPAVATLSSITSTSATVVSASPEVEAPTSQHTTLVTLSKAPAAAVPVLSISTSVAAVGFSSVVPSSSAASPVPSLSKSSFTAAVSSASSTTVSSSSSAAPSTGTRETSSLKRGLVYNDYNLLPGFLNSGSKISWTYNWGQTDNSNSHLDFAPMLWAPISIHTPSWNANAEKAISAGSTHLLSFNECDNASQCNLSPADAATAHQQWLNPFAGKAKIGSPSISSSNGLGQGIDWLKSFISACAGQCQLDFFPIHWYSPPDAKAFLSHLIDVHNVVQKPIWVTEFAPLGSDSENSDFLKTVMTAMDTDPQYSFVERYSYFMVTPGKLISTGSSLSDLGNIFAYN